jgi:hypothetical protein
MNKEKLLFGLGAVSGSAAIVGSGAFSSTQVERGVSVSVVGDESAFLALEPTDGPNGQYASTDSNGLLEVQVSEENDKLSGEGLNPSSYYDLGKVFKITNQGSQAVGVWIEHDSEYVKFKTGGNALDNSDTPIYAEPGDSLAVRIIADTRGSEAETLLEKITIHANADAGSEPAPPSTSATRTIELAEVSPGMEVPVTLTVELDGDSTVNVFERFDTELGVASFQRASIDGESVSPSFVDLDEGGGIVLFDGVGSGTLSVEYSLSVATDAPTDTVSFQPNLVDVDGEAVPLGGVDTIEVIA